LAMLLFTLRGTPFFYMGDEIGAEQVEIPESCIHDPFEKLVGGYGLGRDPERSPMRWDAGARGGFTNGTPWLPLGECARNVADQQRQPRSILNLYRALIALRKSNPCLARGEYCPLRSQNDVLGFERRDGDSKLLVALNTVNEPRLWTLREKGGRLLSSYLDEDASLVDRKLLLRPNEGVLLAVG